MKIKWKQLCVICLAPLDPYYTHGTAREKYLFDDYLIKTNLQFHYNDTRGWKGVKVCKACHLKGGLKFNPQIDHLRRIGILRNIRPKRQSVDRPTCKQWKKELYEILENDKNGLSESPVY
jgi:hypothetical protein